MLAVLAVLASAALVGCGAYEEAPADAGLDARAIDAPTTDGNADATPRDTATRDGTLGDTREGGSDAARDASGDATTLPECPCFDGPGTYCEAEVATLAAAMHCRAGGASRTGHHLYSCSRTTGWAASATCASGCETGETGASASCSLPVCDCFVRASWCGASAARYGLTLDPPCRVPLVPEHDTDILGCNGNTWVVLQSCPNGCNEEPTGTPDTCVSSRTPQDPGWAPCPHRALLHWGLHPEASDRLRCAGVTSAEITQTIGYATASAGYHAPDGTVNGMAYTAAVDLSVRGLTEAEIRGLLTRLGQNGFAAWYRKPGYDGWPSYEIAHIHAVFAGVVMKPELRAQIRDYLNGLNGLASHTPYRFWQPTAAIKSIVRLLFERHYTP